MSTTRPFELTDIFKFNQVNVDAWTATYHSGYYASYLAQWPDFCVSTTGAFDEQIKSYTKHEPPPPSLSHHGHLTALSISPPYRGLGLARYYMDLLESLSGPNQSGDGCSGDHSHGHDHHGHDHDHDHDHGHDHDHDHNHEHHHAPPTPGQRDNVDAFFVDLFVRCNNHRAVEMYEKLGYSVYRRVVDYYNAMEGGNATRDELDGFDMRKSMPKDAARKYVRSNGRDILVSPDQVWS